MSKKAERLNQAAASAYLIRANNDPSAWSMLPSSFDRSDRVELDMTMRHEGALPKPQVAAYTALDLRVGWRLELSLLAQNLLTSGHAEFGPAPTRTVAERIIYGRLTWRN